MRRGRKRRDERGAAAVEAALIMPILFLLVFGMIEMAFLMRDHVAAASATRVGARQATAVQVRDDALNCRRVDAEDPTAAKDVVCAPQSVPLFVQTAATAMQQNGSAMPMSQVGGIAVYDATDPGTESGPASPAECGVGCVWFRWISRPTTADPDAGEFRWVSGSWDAYTINRCATQADKVGVKLFAEHASLTGIIPDLAIDDYTVMTFEPLAVEDCKPRPAPVP